MLMLNYLGGVYILPLIFHLWNEKPPSRRWRILQNDREVKALFGFRHTVLLFFGRFTLLKGFVFLFQILKPWDQWVFITEGKSHPSSQIWPQTHFLADLFTVIMCKRNNVIVFFCPSVLFRISFWTFAQHCIIQQTYSYMRLQPYLDTTSSELF